MIKEYTKYILGVPIKFKISFGILNVWLYAPLTFPVFQQIYNILEHHLTDEEQYLLSSVQTTNTIKMITPINKGKISFYRKNTHYPIFCIEIIDNWWLRWFQKSVNYTLIYTSEVNNAGQIKNISIEVIN